MGLYQSVCDSGDQRGCYGLGTLYERGSGVSASAEKAAQYYNDSCEVGFAPGCSRLGNMYLSGKTLEKDRDLGCATSTGAAWRATSTAVCSSGRCTRKVMVWR